MCGLDISANDSNELSAFLSGQAQAFTLRGVPRRAVVADWMLSPIKKIEFRIEAPEFSCNEDDYISNIAIHDGPEFYIGERMGY